MQVPEKFLILRKVLICKIIINMRTTVLVCLKVHLLELLICQQIMQLNIESYEKLKNSLYIFISSKCKAETKIIVFCNKLK